MSPWCLNADFRLPAGSPAARQSGLPILELVTDWDLRHSGSKGKGVPRASSVTLDKCCPPAGWNLSLSIATGQEEGEHMVEPMEVGRLGAGIQFLWR
jgi:hypothetical protein